MEYMVKVEQGLEASFLQASRGSHRGVDWLVCIEGRGSKTMVMVRTYFRAERVSRGEKEELAAQAMRFVSAKLERGWKPEPTQFIIDESAEPIVTLKQEPVVATKQEPAVAPMQKPWWKLW